METDTKIKKTVEEIAAEKLVLFEKMGKYNDRFGKEVIIAGFEMGVLEWRKRMVPLKDGKLDNTDFGKFLGNKFDYEKPLVIDFYGMQKKSSGFFKMASQENMIIQAVETDIIYFAKIKPRNIFKLSKDLVPEFNLFKKFLLVLRAF